ncbi:MAG: rRNA maturation RNase YbeY [Pseudomonadota bacterium]
MSFVDDQEMAFLNETYRKRTGPTNVMSFAMRSQEIPVVCPEMLGDIVISTETAMREAGQEGIDLEEKIDRLLIHGLLHLLGYDHGKPADARVMFKKEKELLTSLR